MWRGTDPGLKTHLIRIPPSECDVTASYCFHGRELQEMLREVTVIFWVSLVHQVWETHTETMFSRLSAAGSHSPRQYANGTADSGSGVPKRVCPPWRRLNVRCPEGDALWTHARPCKPSSWSIERHPLPPSQALDLMKFPMKPRFLHLALTHPLKGVHWVDPWVRSWGTEVGQEALVREDGSREGARHQMQGEGWESVP